MGGFDIKSNKGLYWFPEVEDWDSRVRQLGVETPDFFGEVARLSSAPLSVSKTNAIDDRVAKLLPQMKDNHALNAEVRIAVLGSSTTTHLLSSIRMAGFRRGRPTATYECAFGQYLQDLLDTSSPLHLFKPNVIVFSFDHQHFTEGISSTDSSQILDERMEAVIQKVRQCWSIAKKSFKCHLIQQTFLKAMPTILGQNEYRLSGSARSFIERLNSALYLIADEEGVDLLDIGQRTEIDGLSHWFSPKNWYRTKQEILPTAAPLYGDLLMRLVSARAGTSKKCLVLDLDNTLWGGVIGDDGLSGIALGQGSGEGESYIAIQRYVKELSRRGIILAICSKNDEKNAWEPFDKHPEMLLRREDIACIKANWTDKATNIRSIAKELSIGLDSLVFLDDNPFERSMVRNELPMVSVPEFPDDPAMVPQLLSDAGYFEGVVVTEEDRQRRQQYQGRAATEALLASGIDLETHLKNLSMELSWSRFDTASLPRVVQLINKTNQFNLTTKRYSDSEAEEVLRGDRCFGLQFRLKDSFADHGIISIIIANQCDDATFRIDSWLMSCRVLGRKVERAALNVLVAEAKKLGASRLIGEFIPSPKNSMVSKHYDDLGFAFLFKNDSGATTYIYDLNMANYIETPVKIIEV